MNSSTLILSPPTIRAEDYLDAYQLQKIADVRLTSPPSHWGDEITQALLRDHPYIPANRVLVNFKQKDEGQGYALAYISIDGSARINIPVVVAQRKLKPIDVMVLKNDHDTTADQGTGNFQDDQVVPLTEATFSQAMDTGDVGDVMADQNIKGTGWSEDGSGLRLPMRGRTVLASVMGTTDAQKTAFANIITKNQDVAAGFHVHGGDVAEKWLNSPDPARSVQNKLASVQLEAATACVLGDLPEEQKTADFLAAPVLLDDGTFKTAVMVSVVDLADPVATKDLMLFDDGRWCVAPEKVAVARTSQSQEEQVGELLTKLASRGITKGEIVSFQLDDLFTSPMKVASITINDHTDTIELGLTDGLHSYPLFLHKGVKTATLSPQGAWVVPFTNRILKFASAPVLPATIPRTAELLTKLASDSLFVSGGAWTLRVHDHPSVNVSSVTEEKIASTLHALFGNAADLVSMAKEAGGNIRFTSDLTRLLGEASKHAATLNTAPEILKAAAKELAMPLELAAKLAAAVGDPQGADAVLATGFLSEDNIAEFAGLSDEFEGVVGKLARLLLLVRLGYPQGDEAAIVVAMKSLQRVSERLRAMIGTVGASPEQVSV